jgi:hypothetical protein
MHLVGLDIGFSKRKRTNAIADLQGNALTLKRLSVEERNRALEELKAVDVLAIDAPILPRDAEPSIGRRCERALSRGLFSKRCKPGMSHVKGTGRTLREHGCAAAELGAVSTTIPLNVEFPHVNPSNIVEAFPNAFLGIAVTTATYVERDSTGSRKKFDWLYEQWMIADRFVKAVNLAGLPRTVSDACQSERDHEKRAALVCLMTAAFVLSGRFVAVGHEECGYFFLPPREMWADWAWSELGKSSSATGAAIIER